MIIFSDENEESLEWPEDIDTQFTQTAISPQDNSNSLEDLEGSPIESDQDQELSKPESITDFNKESDQDFYIFPISLEKADEVCVRLNDLLKRGVISKEKIFYKYLQNMCNIFYDVNSQYDPEVVEFFNTIKYLGGERTVNFLRGPMWHGQGKGGIKQTEEALMNFGGPSRTTRQNKSTGYTTKSGVYKPWLQTFLKIETDKSTNIVPFLDTEIVKVYAVSMQNDGTALKPGIEFDEQQLVNVGLVNRVDIQYVKNHLIPDPEWLKSNVISEANVTYLTNIDNTVSFPVSVMYVPKAGKTGNAMKAQFLSEISVYQTCKSCVERTLSEEHVLSAAVADTCCSSCSDCIELKDVCETCKTLNQPSFIPSLRACKYCLQQGQICIRNVVLALSTDCEAGNKSALESIIEDRKNGSLQPQYIFSCMPDAVHVGKSLKAGFANWMLMLGKERACLAIIQNLRDNIPSLRRILSKDAVMNKDRMDVNCILQLTKESVLETLDTVGHVVHSIVPDEFKINSTNKVGLYPHPIAVTCGNYGKILVLDLQPMKKITRLLEVKLHVPADVSVLHQYKDARSITFTNGIVYVCNFEDSIEMFPTKIKTVVKSMKRDELETQLKQRNIAVTGSIKQLRDKLQKNLNQQQTEYKQNGVDLSKVQLSRDVIPTCITSASDTMLLVASDTSRTIYTCCLQSDGVVMKGVMNDLTDYPPACKTILSLSVKVNTVYVSFSGDQGGVFKLDLASREKEVILTNNTTECREVFGISAVQDDEFVFTDIQDRTVKRYYRGEVQVLAGTGQEGNDSGPSENAKFSQPMGLCIENECNIFITDAQCGAVKLITTVKHSIEFLRHLRLLYAAFSVHMKHTKVPKHSVREAYEKVELLCNFLKECQANVHDIIGSKKRELSHIKLSDQSR